MPTPNYSPFGLQNPSTSQPAIFPTLNLPNINIPNFNSQTINPSSLQTNPQQVYSLLSQSAPQSLTDTLGPLISQIFGTQSNLLAPIFQQLTNQNVASAQSDAMARGLTGSSIEANNMNAARTQGTQSFEQYLASQLNNIVPTLTGLLGTDVSNQTGYLGNLAGAVGQQYSNQISREDFMNMLDANMAAARSANNAQLWGAGIGAGGNILSAAIASDIRLKEDIKKVGEFRGMPVYSFRYKKIERFDLPDGVQYGCMGHEVIEKRPDCVGLKEGYLTVDYGRLLDA